MMARASGLDAPGRGGRRPAQPSRDRFGRFTEWIARAMGTPTFLVILTVFTLVWILWNSFGPEYARFDSQEFGFTVLTLALSLQASYAAPLILLAQNRQDDRDRVQIEQDRQRAERNLADTEYLAREVVALRMAVTDITDHVLTRETLRVELKALLADLDERDRAQHGGTDQRTDTSRHPSTRRNGSPER